MNPVVLIPSCDAFSDCWPATVACLERFWADRPWPVFGMSNHKHWPNPRGTNPVSVGTAFVGNDKGWCANLKYALDCLEFDYPGLQFVLLFLEDMLLVRTVDMVGCIAAQLALLEDRPGMIGAIRLGQGGEQIEPNSAKGPFSEIRISSPYRISTSPTLWRVSYLKEILQHCNSTALEFEHDGTNYARKLPQEVWTMYGGDETKRPFRVYYTAITRGQWDRRAVEWLKRDVGVEVDTTRGFMP